MSSPVGAGVSRRAFLAAAGATTFAVSRGRFPSSALGQSRTSALALGVELAPDRSSEDAELALSVEPQAICRFPVFWHQVQSEPQVRDWSGYEALLKFLGDHGVTALPVLIGCPEWLEPDTSSPVPKPTSGESINAYGAFAAELLSFVTQTGCSIEGVEVWSSPNNSTGPAALDPQVYHYLVQTAAYSVDSYNADRPDDQRKRVIAGGVDLSDTASDWTPFVDGLGTGLPIDIGLQLFPNPNAPDAESYADEATDVIRSALARISSIGTGRAWITSIGTTDKWGDDERLKAIRGIVGACGALEPLVGLVAAPVSAVPSGLEGSNNRGRVAPLYPGSSPSPIFK